MRPEGGGGGATAPLQRIGDGFGSGISGPDGIDVLGDQVCPLLLGGKVGHERDAHAFCIPVPESHGHHT